LALAVLGIAAVAVFSPLACTAENAAGAASKPLPAQTRFPIKFNNGKSIRARLALTDIERSRGLMGCRGLEADEGMLFVYRTSELRAFWMKNVPIDLDIGYFDAAGRLLEVHPLRANDTESVYSESGNVRFCLETGRGWFEQNGMLPGNGLALDLASVEAAVRARGFR
jgi:uncharacterized membrane protein (UPF0127 family)